MQISFTPVWKDHEQQEILESRHGNYRMAVYYHNAAAGVMWYVDHCFPYCGGEGVDKIDSGKADSIQLGKNLCELALHRELLRTPLL